MVTIYKLIDPETLEVKYVGQTSRSLTSRLNNHISEKGGKKGEWIKSLSDKSIRPIIEEVESVDDCDADNAEQFWINEYRKNFPGLLNNSSSPRKKSITMDNPRLSVRDEDGKLRKIFEEIGARIFTGGDIADGVRYAATFTEREMKMEQEPLDWSGLTIRSLRLLVLNGCDFRVRETALIELENRIKSLHSDSTLGGA